MYVSVLRINFSWFLIDLKILAQNCYSFFQVYFRHCCIPDQIVENRRPGLCGLNIQGRPKKSSYIIQWNWSHICYRYNIYEIYFFLSSENESKPSQFRFIALFDQQNVSLDPRAVSDDKAMGGKYVDYMCKNWVHSILSIGLTASEIVSLNYLPKKTLA